jgi:hypothetical protein
MQSIRFVDRLNSMVVASFRKYLLHRDNYPEVLFAFKSVGDRVLLKTFSKRFQVGQNPNLGCYAMYTGWVRVICRRV